MIRFLLFIILLFFYSNAHAQQSRELRGRVLQYDTRMSKGKAAEGVLVEIRETSGSDDTDELGLFRIQIPSVIRSGDEVELIVEIEGFQIYRPIGGKQRVPADLVRDQIDIKLLPIGSRLFLSYEGIELLLEQVADKTREKVKNTGEKKVVIDLIGSISDWANRYGFSIEEVQSEVEAWIANVKANRKHDPYLLGLAAFAENQFEVAAEHFKLSAEESEDALAKANERVDTLKARVIRDYRKQGHAHYANYDFQAALGAYKQARTHTDTTLYAKSWARLSSDVGATQLQLGVRVKGQDAIDFMKSSIASHQQALKVYERDLLPQDLAQTQKELAKTLNELAQRTEGLEGIRLLQQADSIYRQVLKVFTYETVPKEWAGTQKNLANTLNQLGRRSEGQRGLNLLRESKEAYHQSLRVFTRDGFPEEWAQTQSNLAGTLIHLGLRIDKESGVYLLQEAEVAYRKSLEISTLESDPQDWARLQMNLAIALNQLALRSVAEEEGLRLLREAVATYQNVFKVYTREALPQKWALAQMNLSSTLSQLGQRNEGNDKLRLLQEAATALRQALQVFTREAFPQDWALTQFNLANILNDSGGHVKGEEGLLLLQQAEETYRLVLEVYIREALPQHWALVHSNIALALNRMGMQSKGEQGLNLLKKAETEYRLALEVFTREASPQNWAQTYNNLGANLSIQIVHFSNRMGSQGIAEILEKSLSISKELDHLSGYFSHWLAEALNKIAWDWAIKDKNLDKALLYSEQSLSLSANNPNYFDTLAEVYLRMKQVEEARQANEEARQHAGDIEELLKSIKERELRINAFLQDSH